VTVADEKMTVASNSTVSFLISVLEIKNFIIINLLETPTVILLSLIDSSL